MSKQVKECASPPTEDVEWLVDCPNGKTGYEWGGTMHHRMARTAWDAWTQVKGAPAFGSCRVVRVETK